MAVVAVRFNARANPQPSKTSHNTVLEVLWTAVPIMILMVIAVPSFKLLYYQDKAVDAEMTIKAVGHQWYWSYEYPDHGDFTFDSLMIPEDELAPGEPRLLATDTQVVVPVDTTVRLLTTADDVIHSWAIPAFGVKIDSIPGRVSETWFRAERTGIFYGQCSELCGAYHGYMPIMVEVVTAEEFAAWVEQAKEEFARARAPASTVAAWSARGSQDE
jgi:cytochrome c oxidase subunit 2